MTNKLVAVALLGLFSTLAFADTQAIIKLTTPDYSYNASISNINMSDCSSTSYTVDTNPTSTGGSTFNIKVNGQFDGADRACKIDNQKTYFEITKMNINYTFSGQNRTCIIDQSVGTTYDPFEFTPPGVFSKLVGSNSNYHLSCGNGNPDKYMVMPGSDGQIYIWSE